MSDEKPYPWQIQALENIKSYNENPPHLIVPSPTESALKTIQMLNRMTRKRDDAVHLVSNPPSELRGLHANLSVPIIIDECAGVPNKIWDYMSIRLKQIEIGLKQSGTVLKFDPITKTFKRYQNIPNPK